MMKYTKLRLTTLILVVTVVAIAVFSLADSIAKKPTVTEREFPFSITYELNGETVTIQDVYKASFVQDDIYDDAESRVYVGTIGDAEEGTTIYTLKRDADGRLELHTNFYADHLMGDTDYDYFDGEEFAPALYYYDAQEQEYRDDETLSAQGVKLIGFEYPTPIQNKLVFSHIAYCDGEVVFPTLIMALLALVAVLIFVKRDKDLSYKAVDKVAIVLNFVIGLTLVPFVTLAASLIDIEGGGPEFYYQALYFLPSLSVMCTAASVALRRIGYGVRSLVCQLIAPVAFGVYLIVCAALDLL